MYASKSTVPTTSTHTRSRGRIVGWNDTVKLVKEKAIFWHNIWKCNNSPTSGIIFEIRKKTRLDYHYAFRKLKNEDLTLRYDKMSCRVLKKNSKYFWKEVHKVRDNAKMLINSVDGAQGQDIADLFADKYDILYNSVSYDNTDMVTLKTDIDKCIRCKRNNIESGHKVITVQDVVTCIGRLKSGKSDASCQLYSDHFMQGTHRLFVMITLLYSSMMLHGTIPTAMNISTLVPVPKNKMKSLNSSDNYRAIALSSTVGKIVDKVILLKYSNAFITSDQQFGFKQKHSTIQCTFAVNEIINHYNRNGTGVKAILLDASKAFDRVQYVKLFRLLPCRKTCPLVIRCLLNMYIQQQVCVRWAGGGGGVVQPTQLVYPMVSNKAESCHRFFLQFIWINF